MNNGIVLPPDTGGSSRTMLLAGSSVGRLSTSPNAPSAPYSQSRTTVRAKLGSCSCGIDSSSAARNGSAIENSRTSERPNARTPEHQNFRTSELQNFRTSELQNSRTPEPQNSRTPEL